MLACVLVVCGVMTLGLAPGSPLGRLLRQGLVEAPAAWLNAAKPRRVLIGAIAILVLAGFALGAPELLPFVGMVDLTALADLTLLVLVAGGLKPIRRAAEAVLRVLRGSNGPAVARRANGRAVRPRRSRTAPRSDDPAPGWAFA